MTNKSKVLVIAMLLIGLTSCFKQYSTDDTYRKGWTLTWEDSFDNGLDESAWKKTPRGNLFMNKYMSDSTVLYGSADGNLILKGITNPAEDEKLPVLTGGITRDAIKANEVKRIEARVRINATPGATPYITLLPTSSKDNIYIDIIEQYGTDDFVYQSVTSEYTTTHRMPDNPPSSALIGVDPTKYHIYGVEKYADSVVFFVDGTRTKKYPRIPTEIPGQFPFDDNDLDIFIGVRLNQDTDTALLPAEMFIDWVRYYEPEQPEATKK